MTKINNSVKASQVVINCGGEIYHLECARREYGDEAVLDYLRTFYQNIEKLSSANASIHAGQFLNDIDRLKTNSFGFKQMRNDIEIVKTKERENNVGCLI